MSPDSSPIPADDPRVARALRLYWTLAFAITWAGLLPVAAWRAGWYPDSWTASVWFPGALRSLVLAVFYGPTIGGVVVTCRLLGTRRGLAWIGRGLLRWRVRARWWLACALGPFVLFGGLALLSVTTRGIDWDWMGVRAPAAETETGTGTGTETESPASDGGSGGAGVSGKRALDPRSWEWDGAGLLSAVIPRLGPDDSREGSGEEPMRDFSETSLLAAIGILVARLGKHLFLGGGLGEELGWRALALPLLQRRRTALVASLWIGLAWALWHLPQLVFRWSWHELHGFVAYTVCVIFTAILFTWVYNGTGGSLVLPVLLHASVNASGWWWNVWLGSPEATDVAMRWILAALLGALAAYAVLRHGPESLCARPKTVFPELPGAPGYDDPRSAPSARQSQPARKQTPPTGVTAPIQRSPASDRT